MNFKKEFWVLLLIFILPVSLGTLFFYLNPSYFSQNTVNYGELIRPVIVTEKSDIEVIGDDSLEGVWTLVYVTDSCDLLCDEAIEDIKTIRTLINMDMRRIQRMLVAKDGSMPQKDDESLIHASINNEELSSELGVYPKNSIFLIDPIGNFMLYYNPTDLNIKFVIKDLKRLLKYSRIG